MRILRPSLPHSWLLLILCACGQPSVRNQLFSSYENIRTPAPFAPALAVKGNTYKGCFSPDYLTFYFFRQVTAGQEDFRIYQSRYTKTGWSDPVQIDFSETYSDLYPMISPIDTNRIFLTSYRRIVGDTSKKPNANLWYSLKSNGIWTKPTPFPNADLINNYNSQPCITTDGTIYYTSNLQDWSRTITYKVDFVDGQYQQVLPFDPVNVFRVRDTTRNIFEICMAPDKSYMILTIAAKQGKAELFISRFIDKTWTDPKPLSGITGSDMTGNFPYVTPDGKFLLFTKEFSAFYILPTKLLFENR